MTQNSNPEKEPVRVSDLRLLFAAFWDELKETIGTAPTAVLLRRAVIISLDTCPALDRVVIEKNGVDYEYSIPPDIDSDSETCEDIGIFANNVLMLLQKLTGSVLVDQLLMNPLIRRVVSKE